MKLVEGDLEFKFSEAINAIKFDDGSTHQNSSVQPVDFIVEYQDYYDFIEIKDPDIPNASNIESFIEKFKSGKLVNSLAGKFRDSVFFSTQISRINKKINYIVLISMKELEPAQLLTKQEELHRSIPFYHAQWDNSLIDSCIVLNIQQWKKQFGDDSIKRISSDIV